VGAGVAGASVGAGVVGASVGGAGAGITVVGSRVVVVVVAGSMVVVAVVVVVVVVVVSSPEATIHSPPAHVDHLSLLSTHSSPSSTFDTEMPPIVNPLTLMQPCSV
jgi:hypothetical protein